MAAIHVVVLLFAALALQATRGEHVAPILQAAQVDGEAVAQAQARAEAFWNPKPVVRTAISVGEEEAIEESRARRNTLAALFCFPHRLHAALFFSS